MTSDPVQLMMGCDVMVDHQPGSGEPVMNQNWNIISVITRTRTDPKAGFGPGSDCLCQNLMFLT